MIKKNLELNAGDLSEKAFYLLLSLTGIRSEPLINALKDYYVHGLTKSESYKKNGVDKTIFSRKIPVINKAFVTSVAFVEYYKKK